MHAKTILIELRDILAFEIKQAKRHNLDETRITVSRAQTLLNAIRKQLKTK